MDDCICNLLGQKLIHPSNNQWTRDPVLSTLTSGGYCLANDYWLLNSRTRVPAYPMPRNEWIVVQLSQTQRFSSFDIFQGFFQIPICNRISPRLHLSATKAPLNLPGCPTEYQMGRRLPKPCSPSSAWQVIIEASYLNFLTQPIFSPVC